MNENLIGFLANLTSLILWIPQAKTTWKNRNNNEALKGISLTTQVFVICNTLLWCIYGLIINNFWLPLGTVIILPLALITIYLKLRKSNKKEIINKIISIFCFLSK